MNEKVVSQLEAGLRRLQDDGWIQHEYHNPEGRCAIGALSHYRHRAAWYCMVRRSELKYLHAALPIEDRDPGDPLVAITEWNDEHHRTKDEVVALYQTAIRLAKADAGDVAPPIHELVPS